MVDIKCLVCKKSLEIPQYIDPNDYDGQLFCHECNLLWNVRLKSSKVKEYRIAVKQPKITPNVKIITGVPRPSISEKVESD